MGSVKVKLLVCVILLLGVVTSLGVPAFAQTYAATQLPRQPLSQIAANQIITHSGLPTEKLPDGTVNSVTRGRDAVEALMSAEKGEQANQLMERFDEMWK